VALTDPKGGDKTVWNIEMHLKHAALVCSSEENSDRFYQDVLGLRRMRSKILPSTLSKQIFDLDIEYKVIDYGNEDIHFEILVADEAISHEKNVEHICLEVDDLKTFLDKCITMDVEILRIPKGEGILTFIRDYDLNLFEIKARSDK
jgi:catechol 2,3-dioxygenase-like lactoylglutathione lyase family enzyme